ncbi:uncharacterized protein LOC110017905 isoform X4 [Phalaenopsis equestris]|uniref:uncharacterized protein LOC110017905 isoform X4 n=1 Tax=Phalaenopsis equestris TaxID=78828 RepID=UPI0009E1DF13|nr:uncharacterized protein LOC110017905 isoform X4 [Phalaenopsis equestris]
MSPAMTSSNPPPRTIPSGGDNLRRIHRLDAIKALVNTTVNIHPRNVILPRPIDSLRRGEWVKLICGASFEDAADIRNLSLVYTLAGVDCIDCAADESVVNAVNDGINAAMNIGSIERPWVMISVNDDKEDLHFRKAGAKTYIRETAATSELLKRNDVDAIEIHTTGRHIHLFNELWDTLGTSIKHVKLVAVSMPDIGNSTFSTMQDMHTIMESRLLGYNLWQLDGRPMSGDIGRGATREAINFAMRLAAIPDKPHGFYQLAGGTNLHTIDCLKKVGLFKAIKFSGTGGIADSAQALIGGIAYGGYARKIVARVLHKLPTQPGCMLIEDYPEYLMEALREALTLVGPVKSYNMPLSCPQCAQVH